jgi:hypothetical protein
VKLADQSIDAAAELLQVVRPLAEESNRAWNAGDFQQAYGFIPGDFEYTLMADWPDARTLHGQQEVIRFFESFRETFPDTQAGSLTFVPVDGQTLIVGFDVLGTGAGSGASTAMEIWQVWEFETGLPKRVTEFRSRAEALRAAGAEES